MVRRFTANTAFTPDSNAAGEHLPCVGTFRLTETEMTTEPAVFSSRPILGRAPKWFPGVAISFFTDKGDLVPFTQDVIRYGSGNQGRSYWDINVQPGRCGYQQESRDGRSRPTGENLAVASGLRIKDFVPQAARYPGWRNVRFEGRDQHGDRHW